ncbi:MAG: bifunctional phosphopantothenoylcysteine decarboxylase/phosphopantothenate--cysteine ligase CoaBC, partial [Armatimonadetes bacterium]|nr:bifunctional phosphopantothenoylcysteine decarboxylase/phosphopantothenate--cysteine ligase CoaBC [Armatimonadota bacterium]
MTTDQTEIHQSKKILLGVTGSIAAYRAADIAGELVHRRMDVQVVLTGAGARFVGAPTFRAITSNPVLEDLFDELENHEIAHIHLAQKSDLILIAPATANIIAKMALGIADDLLSSILLAATVPIMVAPAMNTVMLYHPATQHNLAVLRDRGIQIIEPAFGELACHTEGYGKLAPVEEIVSAVVERLFSGFDLKGLRFVISAGATREPLDPVRFISNRSSGKMGIALAQIAMDRGASVTLVVGHTSIAPPPQCNVITASSAAEMLVTCTKIFPDYDVYIGAAAISDYRPATISSQKIKKDRSHITIEMEKTEDVLAALAASKRPDQIVVGFAAETNDLIPNAQQKLQSKGLDLVVANSVGDGQTGFESDTNHVFLLWPAGRTAC